MITFAWIAGRSVRFWCKDQKALRGVSNAVEPISKKCFQRIRHSPDLQRTACPDPEIPAVVGAIPVMPVVQGPEVVAGRV